MSGRGSESINAVTQLEQQDGIAVVTVNSPPVNAMGHAVRVGISQGLARAEDDPAIRGAVLMCGGRTFFAGADITELGKPMAAPVLREIAVQIEAGKKPVVAAMHGTALGGGLETALACHARIASASARLGLPEVKLGLLAGAGGTQRLPRLVGVARSLEMCVFGEPITANDALQSGLIDAVAEEDLRGAAIQLAQRLSKTHGPLARVRDLDVAPADPDIFTQFRRTHAQRIEGFEAREANIQCIEAAAREPFDSGMKLEREWFERLKAGGQSAALRYLFFAERAAGKAPVLSDVVREQICQRMRSSLLRQVQALTGSGVAAERIDAVLRSFGLQIGAIEGLGKVGEDRPDDSEVLERCLDSLVDEAVQLVTEGVAPRRSDIDVVCVNNWAWPRYRGGPLFYTDSIGVSNFVKRRRARGIGVSSLLQEIERAGGRLLQH